jgi:hypothetical protein
LYQHDFIKRQIELLAQAIANIVHKREQGKVEEALTEAQQAYTAFGFDRGLLRLDATSVARLVNREKLNALCDLIEEEARLHRALGDERAGAELARLAADIRASSPRV